MPVSRIASMLPGSGISSTSGARRGFVVETIGSRVRTASASVRRRWRSTRRGTTPTRKRTAKTAPAASKMRRRRWVSRAGMTAGSLALIGILRSRSGAELRRYFGDHLLAAQHAVDHRYEHEGGQGRERQPADDDAAERGVLLAALAEAEGHRQHAEDHRERGHDDRAEARRSGGERGVVGVELLLLALLVRELDHQDGVAGRDADAH